MKSYRFYHQETGLILPHTLSTDDASGVMVKNNTPAGHTALEGEYDHLSQRVDLTDPAAPKIVDYQPPQPSDDHEWNAATKRWQLSQAVSAKLEAQRHARQRIAQLEASQHRVIRELALNLAGVVHFSPGEHDAAATRLKAIDDEIARLRRDLA